MKKLLLLFALPLLITACGNPGKEPTPTPTISVTPSPTPSETPTPSPTPLLEFENVYFDDKSLIYDGEAHILDEVRGAPEGTIITYSGREEHIDVGTYVATATLTKEGYNDKTLEATLNIANASFENITFESAAFEYDGEEHFLRVEGAPEFATVRYYNNGKNKVGTYTVTATISAPNYDTLKMTAVLTIVGRNITGVVFPDKTVEYDYEMHYIYVEGTIPDGVSIEYQNNGHSESGSYEVTAILSGEGYESLKLSATLTIKPMELSKPGNFYSRYYIYDGNYHSVEVEYAPSHATITYRCLNAKGTNSFKERGVYFIEATIKTDDNHLSILTAKLVITDEGSIGIDSGKEALNINENLTWDELYDALDQDNFTLEYYSGFYDDPDMNAPIPDGLLDKDFASHTTIGTFATDGKEAYSKYFYDSSYGTYYCYNYYKETKDDIICFDIDTELATGGYSKFPKAAFSETICKLEAADAFVALNRGDNGEFYQGVDLDDFYSDVGTPFIEDGVFTVLMKNRRALNSSNDYRYFYRIYKYYNIGNTAISMPDSFVPDNDYIQNEMDYEDYYLGGVRYGYFIYGSYPNFYHYYSAQLYVTYKRAVFLKPGTYTVLPYIYDEVVRAIVHTSLFYDYNHNQGGYNFLLYVDENGDYQREYSELGSLDRFKISTFLYYGGSVEYYDEWNS